VEQIDEFLNEELLPAIKPYASNLSANGHTTLDI
jgi:hypothetical protein